MKRLETILLGLIVVTYLIVAGLYAVKTPAWQVPDEPAHYNYVRQVAQKGCCPVIETGDWNNDYLDELKAQKFKPELLDKINTVQYEDHQPPLYYLLASPVFAASNGNITILRLFSVLIGAGVIIVAWLVIRTAFPEQPYLALCAAAFLAFLPQHVAMMAGVENDGLAELLVGFVLLACVHYLKAGGQTPFAPTNDMNGSPSKRWWVMPVILGLLLGLTFITKLTAMLPMIPIVGLAVLLRARASKWSIREVIRDAAVIGVIALVFGVPFWVHNIQTYGGTDFLAQSAHDRVVVGQPRTSDYIEKNGVAQWISDGIRTMFKSYWGQFGWMGVPMTDQIYLVLTVFSVLMILGAVLAFFRWRRNLTVAQSNIVILFVVTILLAFGQVAAYNLKFVQFQGRYLFISLIPMSFIVAAGLAYWCSLLERQIKVARWASVGVTALFALADLYILFRIIIPGLS